MTTDDLHAQGSYPAPAEGEDEGGFFRRLAGRHLLAVTFADFSRLVAYLHGAGGARREQASGLTCMIARVDREVALAFGLEYPPVRSPFQVVFEVNAQNVWSSGTDHVSPADWRALHRWLVQRALEDWSPVPPVVLEDYPELGQVPAAASETALGERAAHLARLNALCRGYAP